MSNPISIAVIGAGGKMGTRVSNNLAKTDHTVFYSENSPGGQARMAEIGRTVTPSEEAVLVADVVILAVPDLALGPVSSALVPLLRPGTVVLTLDPAAAYAEADSSQATGGVCRLVTTGASRTRLIAIGRWWRLLLWTTSNRSCPVRARSIMRPR